MKSTESEAAKTKKRLTAVILASVAFAPPATPWFICQSFEAALDDVDIVAMARIVAVDNDAVLGEVVQLEISEEWKGSVGSRYLWFRRPPPFACCGSPSVVDEEALYLIRNGGDGAAFPFRIHCRGCRGRGRFVLQFDGADRVLEGLHIQTICGPSSSKLCSPEIVKSYVRSRSGSD